ncbi:MAG: family 2B encapsulin nanocompartment shell protein [Pseudonocardiaceae bacterium]
MTESVGSAAAVEDGQQNGQVPRSLGTAAARNLATTTKSVPQMQGITSRWLLRVLPWVEATGGTYRVNRRRSYAVGDGRLTFTNVGADVQVIPQELGELPLLRGFDDTELLTALAEQLVQQEFEAGDVLVEAGQPADQVFLIAHGKVNIIGTGKYGTPTVLDVLADGDYFGDRTLVESNDTWNFTAKAVTSCIVLMLPQRTLEEMVDRSDALRAHVDQFRSRMRNAQNEHGEASIELAAGHEGEHDLAGTFVDYEVKPREYQLSVAQTVLRVHSRVADLYNQPMNQVEQQLRLTIEALRERQEQEMINNRDFGLLHNADLQQRIHARTGPPTPDDFDELLATVWRDPEIFLAHPRTIAAFGRECSRRGVYPDSIELNGHQVPAWRGVPVLPCNKIPISDTRTSSVLLFRRGEANQGVIGLHQTGLPDEYQPGLNVRFMNIDVKAIISYLVSTYYSAAVLVPDALGILEDVEIGRES